jgi:hypothetical protein
MLAGQISTHDLWSDSRGIEVDLDALPSAVPVWIREETRQRLDVQVRLAFEIFVKSAATEAGRRHDLIDGHIFKSVAVEKPSRRMNDLHSDLVVVARWIRHAHLPEVCWDRRLKQKWA